MRLDEIFGFGKKEPKLDRTDITPEERAMIKSVFPRGSNADMKKGDGEYVLPQNVNVVLDTVAVNFYKDGDQLNASVAWYSRGQNPGDPKTRPLTHSDHKINNEQDLRDLKKKFTEEHK